MYRSVATNGSEQMSRFVRQSNARAYAQRDHDEYTGGNMPRPGAYRTTAWDQEMRSETVYTPRNIRMRAKYSGKCVECDEPIAGPRVVDGKQVPGEEIEYNPTARRAMHIECPTAPKVPNTETGIVAAQADALLNEYDAMQYAAGREIAREMVAEDLISAAPVSKVIPEGRYTVRPADETVASVLSIEAPSFGNFPEGSRAVSMHGEFRPNLDQPIGVHGGNSRSWLGFAVVKPNGQIVLYKRARAAVDGTDNRIALTERDKTRRAVKALRLLVDAGTSDLLEYGKAYAATENHCFVCRRPLLDETSQKLGIGPVCLKRFA